MRTKRAAPTIARTYRLTPATIQLLEAKYHALLTAGEDVSLSKMIEQLIIDAFGTKDGGDNGQV